MATRTSSRAGITFVALALAIAVAAQPAAAQAAPGADLYVPPGIGVHTWVGQQTQPVAANVVNMGDLAAEDVALTLSVSAGWTVAVPTDEDPPGRSCAVAADARSVTCTYDQIDPGGGVASYLAPVTSPTGPSAPAAVTVSATSPTPDLGEWPDQASDTLPHQGGSTTVTPSTGLAHGQTVRIDLLGRTPNTVYYLVECDKTAPTNLNDCDILTLASATTDSSGNASIDMRVTRYLSTTNGMFDCTIVACSIGTAEASSLLPVGVSPLAFADLPDPSDGIGVTLSGPGDLFADPTSPASVPADLTCDVAGDVSVEFRLHQIDPATNRWTRETDTITVPCTPGAPIAITSDLLAKTVVAGTATVLVRATSGVGEGWTFGQVEIRSHAQAVAELQARLADPDQAAAVTAEFFATLRFRTTYNPEFAQAFWLAVFRAVGGIG
jgi:hypothetical protein